MPSAEFSAVGLRFLNERLRTAVQAAAAADDGAEDALRGLYISDEQALSLANGSAAPDADARLAEAGERLGLDALDLAVLSICAAPELHPRYGFLYAYLQDDVTRRLASPRLVADLLEGAGVDRADVLTSFGVAARLSRAGALRLLQPDGPVALADRPVKVADRLAAYLLGAGGGLAEAGAPGGAAARRPAAAGRGPARGRGGGRAPARRRHRAHADGLRAGRRRDRRRRRRPAARLRRRRARARRGDGGRDARGRAGAAAAVHHRPRRARRRRTARACCRRSTRPSAGS